MSNLETNFQGAPPPRKFKKVFFVQVKISKKFMDRFIISDSNGNSQSNSGYCSNYEGGEK